MRLDWLLECFVLANPKKMIFYLLFCLDLKLEESQRVSEIVYLQRNLKNESSPDSSKNWELLTVGIFLCNVLRLCVYRSETPEGGRDTFLYKSVLVTPSSLSYVVPWTPLHTEIHRKEKKFLLQTHFPPSPLLWILISKSHLFIHSIFHNT